MELNDNVVVYQNGLKYSKYVSGTIDTLSERAVKIKVFGTSGFIWLPKAALTVDDNMKDLYKIGHWFKFDDKTQLFFDRYATIYTK
jgi:hypothetical protein